MEEIVKRNITRMFEDILDYVQVVCPPDNWKVMRSKILRVGNNCIRKTIEDLSNGGSDGEETLL